MRVNSIAFIWGVAEASFFFIVPDVWLSIVGRNNFKKGLYACFWSLAGALLGGSLIFWISATGSFPILKFYEYIPAISQTLIQSVAENLQNSGVISILIAPLYGIPYKLFAAQAHMAGVDYIAFLLVSVPARLIRFIAVMGAAHLVSRLLDKLSIRTNKVALLVAFWVIFYGFYFYLIGS